MSEAEPIPPTSSVTALRIPMIKKGEYDTMVLVRFAKYQENRANGRQEKRIVAIEDSNSKALVATDNNEDIDWTKEFDAEPVTFAMMALTELDQDDWSMEIDAEPVHFWTRWTWSEISGYQMRPRVIRSHTYEHMKKNEYAGGFGVESSSSMKVTSPSENSMRLESLYLNFQKAKGFHAVPPPTDWVDSDDEETVLNFSEIQQKTILNSENSETSFENSPDHLIKDCNLHERTFKQTQTHKPKGTQGSRDTRPVWNNINRVNHSNFSGNSRMDNIRPRTSSFLPSPRSSTTRTPHRPQRPKKIMKSIWVKKESTVGSQAVLPQNVSVKRSAMIKPTQTWRPKGAYLDSVNRDNGSYHTLKQFDYEAELKSISYLFLKFVICQDAIIFSSLKECLILSPKFKFVDEDLVILRAPRKNDVYSLDLKNIIPSRGVTCLVAKATKDEAVLWHRRLGHVNFKNINKLVKGNLVRGLPSKTFKLDHSCLACRKGKQHRASCKKIEERTVREPLELLHMDLFGPVSIESVNRKKYCLVVTDDCSKFSWVFFLAYKDETYDMLHDLIVGLENKLRHKVKTIRCDHGTEFKNHLMNEFCAKKGIKREYSIARTP
ncbi:putative ribonuclease H-like domain-containing protein [Tanacetum coccineum]